jgi:hypothetical protein
MALSSSTTGSSDKASKAAKLNQQAANQDDKQVLKEACGTVDDLEEDEEDEMEEMFIQGPAGMEWGGPTRGGRYKEPTRFGDWERQGRCSDF